MPDAYVLEWKFTPIDYFEEMVEFNCEHGMVQVANGTARCAVPVSECTELTQPELWTVLHEEIEAAFLAAEALAHKPYKLHKPSFERHNEDGSKHRVLMAEAGQYALQGQNSDLGDQRKNRLNRRRELASLAVRFVSVPTVTAMLRSHQAAVNDPDNELVHLYEVRDSLKQHFNGANAARAAVGISRERWDRLGALANDLPLRQGRHRGQNLTTLRDATANELEEGRAISLELIERYLLYLRKTGS